MTIVLAILLGLAALAVVVEVASRRRRHGPHVQDTAHTTPGLPTHLPGHTPHHGMWTDGGSSS